MARPPVTLTPRTDSSSQPSWWVTLPGAPWRGSVTQLPGGRFLARAADYSAVGSFFESFADALAFATYRDPYAKEDRP